VNVCDASVCQFEYFVEVIRSAAEVHTDRLHCMLLAAMLGKRVFAYSTAYGKLEAVYEHSVKEWAHVEFVSGREVPKAIGLVSADETSVRTV
jgi:exopolysaccharide biosynthesis predicted pyruvyltransferase EpsI